MTRYGYARVSTQGQELEVQRRQLAEAGCEVIYSEKITGTKEERPKLNELMSMLRPGDTVVVTKLDRIARSTRVGIAIIDRMVGMGCGLEILNMGRFDDTPVGKLMRAMMLGFAEFERDMIVQRMQEGKEIARQREGYREGRPRNRGGTKGHGRRRKRFGT